MAVTRILIVEDERIIARGIASQLKQLGYAVTAIASSGLEAIQQVKTTQPDLILMDIVLKGEMDGIETAGQIRQHWPIPVIYLTAYADSLTLERAKLTAPFGYILKPLQGNGFHATIQMALQKAADESTLRRNNTRLVQEVQDRVRNNLQVITSLLNLQITRTPDLQARSALQESQNRVLAMALAHQNTNVEQTVTEVTLVRYLRMITDHLFRSLLLPSQQRCYQVSAPKELGDLILSLEQAVPCGLIVNELVTQAIQQSFSEDDYAVIAADNPLTMVQIDLNQPSPSHLRLTISYPGQPLSADLCFEPAIVNSEPLSLRLIQLLTEQLKGQFFREAKDDATVCTLTFAIDYSSPPP